MSVHSHLKSLLRCGAAAPLPLFLVLLLSSSFPSAAQTWTQVWGDDFNGAAGSAPNANNWVFDTGTNWGNGEVDYGTNSTQNAYLDGNGDLKIALLYSASGFCQYSGCPNYTSAHLQTSGKYAAGPYGRIETRLEVPNTPGVGAAFWSLGNDYYSQGTPWPWSGELDMVEIPYPNIGQNGSTVHGGETDGQTNFEYNGLSRQVFLPSGQLFSQAFHVFGTNWMPYRFSFDLDGTTYGTTDLQNLGATDIWAFQQPIYLILSAGVGAANSGTPVASDFPSYFTVDYVHVSKQASGAPAPPTGLKVSSITSDSAVLNWTGSTTSDALYNVYASTTANFTPSLNTLIADNLSGTTFTHSGLVANTTYYYQVVSSDYGGESTAATATITTQPLGNSPLLCINAGGYTIGNWMADTNYVLGGNTNYHPGVTMDTSAVPAPVPPQGVYQVERWGAAAWTITNLNPGASYQVQLHFVETAHTGTGQRAFNVAINGQTALNNFDIYAAAGAANKVVVETFYTKADEYGIIELQTQFGNSTVSGIDLNPTIEAIKVTAGTGTPYIGSAGGSTTSLSINSGGAAVGSFVADEDMNGGDTATTINTINTSAANAAPQAVYQSERYVPFTYDLTGLVPDATYTVRTHFAETYWTAAGDRIFNVVLNGTNVLPNFDVYATAGANTAVVKSFTTRADGFGQIIVQLFAGSADQPFIDGIEAIEASSPVAAPSNLSAAVSGSSIALSWTASSTSGVTYVVTRTTPGSAPVTVASGLSGTTYTDSSSHTAGTTYYYNVYASKSGVNSFDSNTASVLFNGGTTTNPPAAPSSLSATAASTSQINLAWNASSTSGVTYSVFRSTTSGFTASSSTQIKTGVSATTYSDTGLTAGTSYYYLVEAVNSAGSSSPSNQASATTQPTSCNPCSSGGVMIDAGGAASGTWAADTDYSGGGTYSVSSAISTTGVTNPAPQAVYQSARQGTFTYTVPGLTAGASYTVNLHFAELYFTTTGTRQFNVAINGTNVLTNFDIVAAAGGGDKAVVKSFTATANATGQIVIAFTNGAADQPMFNGLDIESASTSSTTAQIDVGGAASGSWLADTDYSGGGTYSVSASINASLLSSAPPQTVLQSARQGAFTYTIPGFTAGSSHTVNLYFAELYFTTTGQRAFNVSINGTSVLTNFDIVAAAGAGDKAILKSFTATANSSGQIVISCSNGTVDQPMLNGISVQ